MKKKLIVTVGNEMMGDDAVGPLLARMIEHAPIENWDLIDGGNAPENHLWRIREMNPEQVLIVDAAEMGLEPGEVRFIGTSRIEDPFFMTTHTLPLTYLVMSLREFIPKVELLGVQPQVVAFGYPVFAEVKQAVTRIYEALKQDEIAWEYV
jgi:hydrogenase 3 maturation protease